MVDILLLTKKDVGRWVEYNGAGGEIETGRIKSWGKEFIFVVYHCNNEWDRFQDFTGQATKPKDLNFLKEEEKI